MNESSTMMYVFAGNNGSGKSTIRNMIIDRLVNIERVETRVLNGGHYIPTEDIIRRHTTSIQHLHENLHLIDHLLVIDNSEAVGVIVLQADYRVVKFQASMIPHWVQSVRQLLI